MGGSSPPFLYGPPSAYAFAGPTDRPFNPKAVTEASWTRPKQKPKPKGPLVDFNKHPDSYSIPTRVSRWTPMSPHTKSRVIHGRQVQLGLRVLALLGALGSLFCAIVIENAAASIIWIVRVAPAVAILHTLYAIYHLSRSAISRPPGSQASYMLFASIFDSILVAYYVFSAYLGYMQWTYGSYHWETRLGPDSAITTKISETLFLLSIVNGALHLISFGISVALGLIFRQIRSLPPDLNPLEDNLTARPHKRNKSEFIEKHTSQSTLDSAMSEDPLIAGYPRTMEFMQTRMNSADDANQVLSDLRQKRNADRPSQSHRISHADSLPQMPVHAIGDPAQVPAQSLDPNPDDLLRPTTSFSYQPSIAREPSPGVPARLDSVSPGSDNWIAYPSREPTPAENAPKENQQTRDPSSVYSRTNTPGSVAGGAVEWTNYSQRFNWNTNQTIQEDAHGQYESIPAQEFYGNEDDEHIITHRDRYYDEAEQDIGDNQIHIFPDDHELSDEDVDELDNSLRVNPLALNPPTPQPIPDQSDLDLTSTPAKRIVLDAIPNLSPTPPSRAPVKDMFIPRKNGDFYGELEQHDDMDEDDEVTLRDFSGTMDTPAMDSPPARKPSKLSKRESQKQKKNTYGALKQHDPEDENPRPNDSLTADSDRKGRVISNSGADISRGNGSSASTNLSSYGSYLAGLGVGRRRDVSGKMAEEGRSGPTTHKTQSRPVRAAGWARFAGL